MKRAIILYKSKKGTTKKLGEKINQFLNEKGISTKIISIDEYNGESFSEIDYVILGCWTSGLLFFGQKPTKEWIQSAKKLPRIDGGKTILFTTYKLRVGNMFRNMMNCLNCDYTGEPIPVIKSRNGELHVSSINLMNRYLSN